MPKSNPFLDEVYSLSDLEFSQLNEAVTFRKNKEKFGFTTLDEAALKYQREVSCPNCGSISCKKDGKTKTGKQRYRCNSCGNGFVYLSNSIFNSTKKDFNTWAKYIALMIHYPSLELAQEICEISHPTAFLWRHKIFETVNGYQDHLKLRDRIWIDETHITDSSLIRNEDYKEMRGLSRNKICIIVAIDIHKNMIAVISGHGKPNAKRVKKALADHIARESTIVHDGDRSHMELIKELNCKEEYFKANPKDKEYLASMELINNMCSWIKRYIYRFVGMKISNLQSYLNWFVYLLRVKKDEEKYPKTERIIRHLLLNESRFTRK